MSTPAQYLLCDSEAAARAMDETIMAHLRAVDGSKAARWSGPQKKNDGSFGILWESSLATILGEPKDKPEMIVESASPAKVSDAKTSITASNWTAVEPTPAKAEVGPAPTDGGITAAEAKPII